MRSYTSKFNAIYNNIMLLSSILLFFCIISSLRLPSVLIIPLILYVDDNMTERVHLYEIYVSYYYQRRAIVHYQEYACYHNGD